MRIATLLLLVGSIFAFTGSFASGDTIQYSTSGYFGSAPGATSVTSGAESISFAGVSGVPVNTPSIISLGDFTPSFGADGTSGAFDGDLFTLVITQIANGVTSMQSLTATLSGSLSVSPSGSFSSGVIVNYGSQTALLNEGNGQVASYAPFTTPVGTEITTGQAFVSSSPAPVTPVPRSLVGGAGLLGLIAVCGFARRVFAV